MERGSVAAGTPNVDRSAAKDLIDIGVESRRMGTGWIVLVVFGPLGIFGLGFVWVAVTRLRRIHALREMRGWWLAVGVTATTVWVAFTTAFGFLIASSAVQSIPSVIGAVVLVCAAVAGAATVAAWHVASGQAGEPLGVLRKVTNSLTALASVSAVFTAGVLWGGPADSVEVVGAVFTVVPAGMPLDWLPSLLSVAALLSFHRTQSYFRAGLESTAEAQWQRGRVQPPVAATAGKSPLRPRW